jgi:hypothetical protein
MRLMSRSRGFLRVEDSRQQTGDGGVGGRISIVIGNLPEQFGLILAVGRVERLVVFPALRYCERSSRAGLNGASKIRNSLTCDDRHDRDSDSGFCFLSTGARDPSELSRTRLRLLLVHCISNSNRSISSSVSGSSIASEILRLGLMSSFAGTVGFASS